MLPVGVRKAIARIEEAPLALHRTVVELPRIAAGQREHRMQPVLPLPEKKTTVFDFVTTTHHLAERQQDMTEGSLLRQRMKAERL